MSKVQLVFNKEQSYATKSPLFQTRLGKDRVCSYFQIPKLTSEYEDSVDSESRTKDSP